MKASFPFRVFEHLVAVNKALCPCSRKISLDELYIPWAEKFLRLRIWMLCIKDPFAVELFIC